MRGAAYTGAMAVPALLPVPVPPIRTTDTHKGSFGSVLVVAGSRRYPGAAVLTALGAGRAGAGLVRLAVPDSLFPVVVAATPFATVQACPGTEDGGLALAAWDAIRVETESADVLVAGPGLGTHPDTGRLVRHMVEAVEVPLVLDADALNLFATALAEDGADLRAGLARRAAPLVLLPHPGEFARLAAAVRAGTGTGTVADGADAAGDASATGSPPSGAEARRDAALALARALRAVVVLKGHASVTTDGTRVAVETAGNPGMATGGMGDVLAGVVGAVLAGAAGIDRDDPAAAVALAVRLHAVAGDLAAADLGPEAVLPADVADRLGAAYEALRAG